MSRLKDVLLGGLGVGGTFLYFSEDDKVESFSGHDPFKEVYSKYEGDNTSTIQFKNLKRIDASHFLAEYPNEAYLYGFDEGKAQVYVRKLSKKEKGLHRGVGIVDRLAFSE